MNHNRSPNGVAVPNGASGFLNYDDVMREERQARELKATLFGKLLAGGYRLLACHRRRRLGNLLMSFIIRREGAMTSATARKIMREDHGVEIGAYSYGECFNTLVMPAGVTIGRYVSFAPGVRIFLQNHPLDRLSTHPIFYERSPGNPATSELAPGRLEIGNDVWIGCNALITPGCQRIGNGAVIGAGAVVTKDVPDFAVVAGNPARRIRNRFSDEVIEKLQHAAWWNYSRDEVLQKLPELTPLLNETPVDINQLIPAAHCEPAKI